MCPSFTSDDVGKRVENANGEQIGIVGAVDPGIAYVEPDPGVTDSVKAALGWKPEQEDAIALEEAAVSEITDEVVRLREEYVDPAEEMDGVEEFDDTEELDSVEDMGGAEEIDGTEELNPDEELDGADELNPSEEMSGVVEVDKVEEDDEQEREQDR